MSSCRSGRQGRIRAAGSIYQRSDGRWRGVVDLGWQESKRARKFLYGKSRADVAARLTKALRDLQQGIAPADDRVTVGAWITRHLDDVEASNEVRHPTLVRYRGILRKYILPVLGKRQHAQLQPGISV